MATPPGRNLAWSPGMPKSPPVRFFRTSDIGPPVGGRLDCARAGGRRPSLHIVLRAARSRGSLSIMRQASMARDSRYDILFEPVRIGPVTAKNRFYQVPHCNGMGHVWPRAMAAMRGIKAEGGWAVVCTEEADIHPSSDISPFPEMRIWDDRDLPALALMAESVHAHGALAGVELTHHGPSTPNRYSREVPLSPSHEPVTWTDPVQARAMDKSDIRNYRLWHREAALRAKRAGFDIV